MLLGQSWSHPARSVVVPLPQTANKGTSLSPVSFASPVNASRFVVSPESFASPVDACGFPASLVSLAPPTLAQRPSETRTDSIPRPIGFVNDFEGIFTAEQRDTLENLLADYRHSTTNEIAVMTVDADMTTRSSFDNYTLKVFNTWGIGVKGKDNGVLIAISRAMRMVRIQNGYGIVKILSNKETKEIIDNEFFPDFRKNDIYAGTLKGIHAIMSRLAADPEKQ